MILQVLKSYFVLISILSVDECNLLSFSFPAAAIGISFIQFSNNNSMRNHYVLGLALFLGISIPQYFVSNTTGDGHGPIRADGGWVSRMKTPQAFSRFPTFFGHHLTALCCSSTPTTSYFNVKSSKKNFYKTRNMFGRYFRTEEYDFTCTG